MAPAVVLSSMVLGTMQTPLEVIGELGAALWQRMQQRVAQPIQEMAQLIQKMEQRPQELSKVARGPLLLAALEQWQFWAFAGGLVLLFWPCWRFWKRSHEPGSSSKHGSSRSLEDDDEEEDEEEDPLHMDRYLYEYKLGPLPKRLRIRPLVKKLVDNLLCVCRMFSGNGFMPRLQPAVEVGIFLEGCNARGEDLVYRLLVPLKSPPGHSFHLQLGTKGDMLVRNSCLRVGLESMCAIEHRWRDMLCFLHHPEDRLISRQEASLLQTLCTGSYLDMQKTAFWLQVLMTAACIAVPQVATCKLTVLPSSRFCKITLTNASNRSLTIELILAVQHGNLNTFVTME